MRAPTFFAKRKRRLEITFQGIPIHIETPAGSYREWVDPHNNTSGRTRMEGVHYGEIPSAPGLDGDPLDVFVGPHQDAKYAYLIMIRKAPDFREDDELKTVLGVRSRDEATAIFHLAYSDPRFIGSIREMPIGEFRQKVLNGVLIKSFSESQGKPQRNQLVLLKKNPLLLRAFRTVGIETPKRPAMREKP